MARILVTGGAGFIGSHVADRFLARGDRVVILDNLSSGRRENVPRGAEFHELDIGSVEAARLVRDGGFDVVAHLAAQIDVRRSVDDPMFDARVNVLGTLNVAEAVRAAAAAQRPRIVFASTGEVYGSAEQIPTREDGRIAPLSPYAASKAAAEVACEQAARAYGLDVAVARAFPHTGPGQDVRFAVGSWARQLVDLERAGGGTLHVGDLSARRDMLDVRDVCRAYEALLDDSIAAGTYNVATGRPVALAEVVEMLVAAVRVPVEVVVDPARLRPAEVPVLSGDASRLRRATGWKPTYRLEHTLQDTLAHERELTKMNSG